jgi:hypothetical protein
MKLYVVGMVSEDSVHRWSLCGIYNSEKRAVERCTTKCHFVGPFVSNKDYPDKSQEWEGGYYPLRQKRGEQ